MKKLWKQILSESIVDGQELLRLLDIHPEDLSGGLNSETNFPILIPPGYLAKIEKGNPNDPLLRQIIPTLLENEHMEGYSLNPLGEKVSSDVPGVLHKYNGRILFIINGVCPIHCRYCFRRYFPYSESSLGIHTWIPAIQYLESHTEVNEVILSGGDPLSVSNSILSQLIERLEQIKHVKTIRIHTRFPVVLPERIDSGFIDICSKSRLKFVIVIHSNHPNELDNTVSTPLKLLYSAGVTLLNQSVLLRNVNDDSNILAELSRKLIDVNVLPYYVHLLDKVEGAAHYEVDDRKARSILHQLYIDLPGYLVPKFVREVPGMKYKVPLIFDIDTQ